MRGLPLQWMTRPDEAPLNLATQLPSNANPTDLGPKSYIAFGTPEARGAVAMMRMWLPPGSVAAANCLLAACCMHNWFAFCPDCVKAGIPFLA